MGEVQEYRKLTREELETLAGEELPEKAAMSLINANVAAPINAAVALNVASDNSLAYANATQDVDIDQSAGSVGWERGEQGTMGGGLGAAPGSLRHERAHRHNPAPG